MTDIQTLLHALNMFMFSVAFFMNIYSAIKAYSTKFNKYIKRALFGASIYATGLSLIFIVLQMDWMIQNHNQSVGDYTSYAWLVFDYLLVLFLISASQIISALSEWSTPANAPHCRWYERELPDKDDSTILSGLEDPTKKN